MENNYYSIAYITKLLKQYNLIAKKHYGQNFLIDKNVIDKIVHSSKLKDQIIIEIGPGLGSLTRGILEERPKKIFAYEIDKNMCSILNNEIQNKDLVVINEDFLVANLNNIDTAVLMGNLPYYITSKILFKAIESIEKWEFIIFMMQKEVYERLIAQPKTSNYSKLAATINLYFSIKHIKDVGANVFFPKPSINSSIIKMTPKKNILKNANKISNFIKVSFQMRRKTLVNNLKTVYDVNKIHSALEKLNLNILCRPQDLSTNTFIDLFQLLDID